MGFTLLSLLYYLIVAAVIIILVVSLITRQLTSPYPETYRSAKEKTFLDPSTKTFKEFPDLRDSQSLHLSVIVPAYNEEERLPPMLKESLTFLEERCSSIKNFSYEMIIVSDGSTDKTVQVALDYSKKYGCEKIRVLELEKNRGKGGAVKMGVMSSRGAVILFADADGATTFADLVKLEIALKELTNSDYLLQPEDASNCLALICGSRAHLESEAIATRSFFRNILMHGFHMLVWLLAVRSTRDTQCGFKLFTRETARRCFKSLHINKWAFDVELLYIAEYLKISTVEIAVRWTEIGGSKLVPVWSWLQMGSDLVLLWFKYTIGAWKLVK